MRRQSEPEIEESEEHHLIELLQPKLLKRDNSGFSDCGCRRGGSKSVQVGKQVASVV